MGIWLAQSLHESSYHEIKLLIWNNNVKYVKLYVLRSLRLGRGVVGNIMEQLWNITVLLFAFNCLKNKNCEVHVSLLHSIV